VEMSDSSRARAASGEAGKRSRGDGGFDRLLTFSSGLPLPDPLASPRAKSARGHRPRASPAACSGASPRSSVSVPPRDPARNQGGRGAGSAPPAPACRTGRPTPSRASRRGHPSRHRDHRGSRPPRASRRARPALSALQILSASNPACLKPARQAREERRENRRLF
jgi:hypothetical protein